MAIISYLYVVLYFCESEDRLTLDKGHRISRDKIWRLVDPKIGQLFSLYEKFSLCGKSVGKFEERF